MTRIPIGWKTYSQPQYWEFEQDAHLMLVCDEPELRSRLLYEYANHVTGRSCMRLLFAAAASIPPQSDKIFDATANPGEWEKSRSVFRWLRDENTRRLSSPRPMLLQPILVVFDGLEDYAQHTQIGLATLMRVANDGWNTNIHLLATATSDPVRQSAFLNTPGVEQLTDRSAMLIVHNANAGFAYYEQSNHSPMAIRIPEVDDFQPVQPEYAHAKLKLPEQPNLLLDHEPPVVRSLFSDEKKQNPDSQGR